MLVAEVIMKLVVVVLLASYLLFKHRQRLRNWSPKENPNGWTGRGIDATRLKPAVDQVRHDYLAARSLSDRDSGYRRHLLSLIGRAVRRLSFFQKRKTEEDAPKHAA